MAATLDGDGDTCIIGEEFNERELAAFSSTAGTFIYDITRAKKATEGMYGGYFSEKFINLCKFIPKSNSTDLNFFNQCKFNKSSQVLYEQPGGAAVISTIKTTVVAAVVAAIEHFAHHVSAK